MKIENEAVILTEKEEVAAAHRDMLVGFGDPVQAAAQDAITHMSRTPSKKFVEWLSEGTLTVTNGEVVTVEPDESEVESETESETKAVTV